MSARARLWASPCRTQPSPRLAFRLWSGVGRITNRTAVYGSVRTVVWEGRRNDPPPIPIKRACATLSLDLERHRCDDILPFQLELARVRFRAGKRYFKGLDRRRRVAPAHSYVV